MDFLRIKAMCFRLNRLPTTAKETFHRWMNRKNIMFSIAAHFQFMMNIWEALYPFGTGMWSSFLSFCLPFQVFGGITATLLGHFTSESAFKMIH